MHGLKTIRELNELAVQNSMEGVNKVLRDAEEFHRNRPSHLCGELEDVLRQRAESREAAIVALESESFDQLIGRIEALELLSTLEAALSRKLKKYLEGFSDKNEEEILP